MKFCKHAPFAFWLVSIFLLCGVGVFESKGRASSLSESTQSWAVDAVWYQIFPERFSNGDKQNDPDISSLKGAYPHDNSGPWAIHPWGADWYELQDSEKSRNKGLWHAIQLRRTGGDLQGILDKLDYLSDLGVTALYLNPVFWAPSSHKYDGKMYHHIDPNFGPDPVGDERLIASEIPDKPETWQWTKADKLALTLVREVHRRGMKIIFDGVFNHLGQESFAFRDVVEHQESSRFKEWFTIHSWNDPQKGTIFNYDGWFGVKELPELREDSSGIVRGPREYIFAATRRWMDPDNNGDPSDGIDGWRLDVAFCVAHPFWKEWSALVRKLNPAAYTTAEVIDSPEKIRPFLEGDEFDAVMNYNFAFAAMEFFVEKRSRIDASELDARLKRLRDAFPPDVAYRMQNLLDSHDTNRVASHIANRERGNFRNWGDYFGASQATNLDYNTRAPVAQEREIQKLLIALQMTYVGAPMIYYGDEAGMWGANDPDCRKPMVWPEISYENETVRSDGTKYAEPQPVRFNGELYSYYKRLIAIRRENPALSRGSFETLFAQGGIYLFARKLAGQPTIYVIFNRDEFSNSLPAHVLPVGSGFDEMIGGETVFATEGLVLPPFSVRILTAR
jgi:cyclomaltodextrinase